MTNKVDTSVQQQRWPADRYHPLHDTFKAWLDDEAPHHDTALHTAPSTPRAGRP